MTTNPQTFWDYLVIELKQNQLKDWGFLKAFSYLQIYLISVENGTLTCFYLINQKLKKNISFT